jgi:hypothetical protein
LARIRNSDVLLRPDVATNAEHRLFQIYDDAA